MRYAEDGWDRLHKDVWDDLSMVFNSQSAVNLGSAFGSIVVDMRDTERDINAQVRNLENGISRSMQRIGDRLQSIGAQLTLSLSPVTLLATRGLAVYAEFDDILTEIEARTGATADEMERVRTTALQMGQDTAFSATQAADAMLQLLSSGYDLEQTFLALQPVLDLAAAGALDLGYAADAVTDILAQFQLGADKATEVSDALAQASGASSATISQLIDAFANVGPLASSFNLSVEDTAAILALFAENGIKGAEAGTQLKSMLTNLSRDVPEVQRMWEDLGVSLYDSNGNFRDLNTVIEDLAVAMADMTDEERNNAIQTLAGSYGQMGLNILLAADGFDDMAAAMGEAATAQDLAAARMDSFRGKSNQLKSSLETLSLNVLAPLVENYLEPLVVWLTETINKVNEWLVANPELASAIGMVVGALAMLGPSLFVIGRIISLFGSSISGVIGIVRLFGTVVMAAFSPVGAVIAAAIALGVALYSAWESNFMGIRDTLLPIIEAVGNALGDLVEWFGGLVEVFQADGLSGAFDYLGTGIGNLLSGIWDAIRNVDWPELGASILRGIGAGIGAIATWVYDNVIVPLAEGVANYISSGQLWDNLVALGSAIFDAIGAGLKSLADIQMWVYANVILPIALSVRDYVTSGQLWDDLMALGSAIFDAIGAGLKSLADIQMWVYANVILPIALSVRDYVTSGQLWDDLMALGSAIFDAIGAGIAAIGDLAEWLLNNLIVPMAEGVAQYVGSGQLWDALGRLGKSILDGLAAGLGSVAAWVQENIINPILSPLHEVQQMIGDILGWETQIRIRDSGNAAINPGNLFAPGVRDSGGPGRRGNLYYVGQAQMGREAFIAGDNGHFYPDFAENLARIAGIVMGQHMPQPQGVDRAVAAGNTYNISISVPVEVLRDEPNLQRNADTFAEQIMSRLRSR
ncbi:MAG: phage tail tape measure protein [Gammaproteobacteria bacterium]|nr:MAG: phage tail tape measure protein [Gammaproteobacteria bacterium]